MNLVIDIGNTRTKYAVFNKSEEIFFTSTPKFELKEIHAIIRKIPATEQCILSATGNIEPSEIESLRKQFKVFLKLDHNVPMPFKSLYKTPETLGLDRLAAISAAQLLYRGKNVLIIDAGTAITFDFKNANDEFIGGNISPGLEMRFKALNYYTEKLPLVKSDNKFSLLGLNTIEAITNGVQNGIIHEINGIIRELDTIYEDLTVLLTGGDVQFFEIKLKRTIFVVQNLICIGLNYILNYNVENS